ncbi:MAG: MarR family winged helix-turn-helix transcriptional regulator [Planctomycetota bacterium]
MQALRRIMRAADLFSHKLAQEHTVTGPQLVCLIAVAEHEGLTVSQLSQAVYLSSSTVVGILDRLERRGLLERRRGTHDRRQVLIHPTATGLALLQAAPSPLQQALCTGLDDMAETERDEICICIEKLVHILESKGDRARLIGIEPLDLPVGDSDSYVPPTTEHP